MQCAPTYIIQCTKDTRKVKERISNVPTPSFPAQTFIPVEANIDCNGTKQTCLSAVSMLSQSLYSKRARPARAFGTLIIASQQNEQEEATPSAGFSLFLQLVVRARGCRGARAGRELREPRPPCLASRAGDQCQPAAHRLAS
jgi:hypothetical protein